ncbi:MAG: thioredoxin-disulfide reductase [Dehalococcoidia bacterium]|nr:thioredoxin-disulfide reductase [Dehalococcoidia bacterium]
MGGDYDVVILGGGVSGLSAGLYTVRAKLKTILLEKEVIGGQIINTDIIENYPGFPDGIRGVDLVMACEGQASKFGLEVTYDEAVKLDVKTWPFTLRTAQDDTYRAKAVIVATGGAHKKLGVPGEEEFEAKGVSYCATCDGNFFTGQDVAVIGGGDSALDEGLYLTQMCNSVTVIHRRDQLRASKILQERAHENPKVKFIWNSAVEEIKGDGQVNKLLVKNLKTNQKAEMPMGGIFIYIGFYPQTQFLQGVVPLDASGHVKVDLNMHTEVPGVFAAGDCRWHSVRQLASSVGDGVTAAIRAFEFVMEKTHAAKAGAH